MFDRFKNALRRPATNPTQDDPVARWASSHFLSYTRLAPGQFEASGLLLERSFRAECKLSSRTYIQGLELRARVDLDLPPVGHVIVMSGVVRKGLEKQANKLYEGAVENVQTSAKNFPEEVRWLSLFREAIWQGPPQQFWERYSVLTDAPELARRWLDQDALDFLMAGTSEAAAAVPVLVMLMRGRCYLRLQVNPLAEGADALLALELLEHLSTRAIQLAGRSGGA